MGCHIQRGALPDLRLGRSREDHINFEVLRPMRRLGNEMKRTVGLAVSNRSMVIVIELTTKVRGKNSVDCPPMFVIYRPMPMVGLGMDMDQWRGKHP